MSDNGKMGLLAIALVSLGSVLCWIGGAAINWLLTLGLAPHLAAAVVIVIVIAALAVSCWACLALVRRMYGRTYG